MSGPPAPVGHSMILAALAFGTWSLVNLRDPDPGDGAIGVMAIVTSLFVILYGCLIVVA